MTYAKLERFEFILKQLDIEGKIIVANIADALQVAPETIRRDFDELEQQHLLSRVHGGAIKYTNVRNEPVFYASYKCKRRPSDKLLVWQQNAFATAILLQ